MMTPAVKRIYQEAQSNEVFKLECKNADPEKWCVPTWIDSIEYKAVFAAAYYGWLIAKGEFIPGKYYY